MNLELVNAANSNDKYRKGVYDMECKFCRKECKSENALRQHSIRCKNNPEQIDLGYLKTRKNTEIHDFCKFCEKHFTSLIGLSNHSRRCQLNPDRKIEILTESGRERIRQGTINNNKEKWDKNSPSLSKLKNSMKVAVDRNPDAYTSGNRGRTKQFEIDGIKLHGLWEVDFYKWCKQNLIDIVRPTKGFEYNWNGQRTYFPDFFIPSIDSYIEVKGYETERDYAKWNQFPKKLIIIKEKDIKEIRKGTFKGLVT